MDFTGHIVGLAKDYNSKLWHLTLELDQETALEAIQDFDQFSKLAIHIVKWRKKRSLDANAYLWVLCGKIANAIQSSKDEVYEEMLQRYGTYYRDDDGYVTVTIKSSIDVSKVSGHWRKCGVRDDGEFTSYIMIKGSSDYDTEEMSKLLDGVISEARELGIDTESDKEKMIMLQEWGRQYEKHHNG